MIDLSPPPVLSYHALTLKLRNPFHISYGVSDTRTAHWLRLPEDAGWGEGTIPAYYHISDESMFACWEAAAGNAIPLPDDLEGIPAWVGTDCPAPGRAALDLALHDRLGRLRGLPLYRLLDLPQPVPLPTSFTISIGEPDEMARMALEAAAYPILKVKLGTEDDVSRLKAIRQARPDARLRVDANAGWTPAQAVANIEALAGCGLEMVEQPVPKADIAGMGWVQKHTPIPIVADESVTSLEEVERLAEAGVKGINLKLMKVGGLSPAVRILKLARQNGMKVMLGCMIETSIGVTAMAHLSGLADWLDLDAPLLISNDPFEGVEFDAGAGVHIPDRPGIGVILRDKGRLFA